MFTTLKPNGLLFLPENGGRNLIGNDGINVQDYIIICRRANIITLADNY
jgi:hypothetical protein